LVIHPEAAATTLGKRTFGPQERAEALLVDALASEGRLDLVQLEENKGVVFLVVRVVVGEDSNSLFALAASEQVP
jgi:hypothetical protein